MLEVLDPSWEKFLVPLSKVTGGSRGHPKIDPVRLAELRRAGKSLGKIAQEFDCAVAAVCRACKKHSLPTVYRAKRKTNVRSRGFPDTGCILGRHWSKIVLGAEERGIPFEITQEEAWEQFVAQGGRCHFSGVPLLLARNSRQFDRGEHTGSLDRLSNEKTKGYTLDNIVWVHKYVNVMRNEQTPDAFVAWCKAVVQHALRADAISNPNKVEVPQ